jgi:uncharacterized protein (DUF488 family)
MNNPVYTIGHSTHLVPTLLELLRRHRIEVVADVRSQPYSRMNPQFNREDLKEALHKAGIKYVFLGKELGARSDDKTCYENGRIQYDRLATSELFKQGLQRVKEGARSYRIALMCAEKEPLECHRTILVSRRLFDEGIEIKHILGNGEIEGHDQTIRRLLERLRMPEGDMFMSNDEIVRQAYMRQANEIAYQEQEPHGKGAVPGPAPGVAE